MYTELKQKVYDSMLANHDEICALADAIAAEPELGFKEEKTAKKVANLFAKHNIPYTSRLAITGVKGMLHGKSSKCRIAVLGELDAVPCPNHPLASKETGAAHACGHNVQLAIMAACTIGLKESGILSKLDGDVIPFAVPAEEYVEISYRNQMRDQGKLHYLCGKEELIRIGAFDDIDMSMMMHASMSGDGKRVIDTGGTSNGFIGKLIHFKGKAAHAAAAPHDGVNALNAAMLAINAVNALRETFREEDCVRFHPIITKGGDSVNVVPSSIHMESYVRAKTVQAMLETNKKINKAIKYAAMAVGAEAEIQDLPGQLPMINNQKLNAVYEANVKNRLGENAIIHLGHQAGSTDMGDLSHIMPVIHPWFGGGTTGIVHSVDFKVTDTEMAYFLSAATMTDTIIDLLADGAVGAENVLHSYQSCMTKEEYLQYLSSIR
ncbi:MAG: amidohydrolase [Selenomonadaceae bacterium]